MDLYQANSYMKGSLQPSYSGCPKQSLEWTLGQRGATHQRHLLCDNVIPYQGVAVGGDDDSKRGRRVPRESAQTSTAPRQFFK